MTRMNKNINEVREFWDFNPNTQQFVTKEKKIGTKEYFEELDKFVDKTRPYRKKLIQREAKGCEGKNLLEVGCGIGYDIAHWAEYGLRVNAIDLTPFAVKMARQRLKLAGYDGQVKVGNAESLDFFDESFDLVTSFGVLHHTPDTQGAIDEIYRVLRRNGKTIVILYHKYSWMVFLSKVAKVPIEFQEKEAPIVKTYTRSQVMKMFSKFKNLRIETEHYYPVITNRNGLLAEMYNHILVPATRHIPTSIIRPFGFHLVISGFKE